MRFSLQDVKKQVQRRGGELYVSLHFLRPGELRTEIERLAAYHEQFLNQPRRLFSLDEARACLGDYRLANCLMATLSAWYNWQQPRWEEALQRFGVETKLPYSSPVQLRLALYDYVNEHFAGFLDTKVRSQALQAFAELYGLSVPDLEYLLALDSEDEALLVRTTPEPPGADEVSTLYNQWVFEAALFNASDVHFLLNCNAFGNVQNLSAEFTTPSSSIGTGVGAVIKRLCYLARKLGVYYDLAYEPSAPASAPLLHLTLYGPQEMTGVPQQYGLRLARLCRMLLNTIDRTRSGQTQRKPGTKQNVRTGTNLSTSTLPEQPILEAEATVHFLQRSYRFVMNADLLNLLPVNPARDVADANRPQISYSETSQFDSSIEQSFAEAFSALENSHAVDGWRLEREPEPLLLEHSVFIPDFALTRTSRRIYVEILGFWTPSYRERKIAKLQQLEDRNDLVLAIPVEARTAFASIAAAFPIIWYEGQLSATELLHVLRSQYDDFEERLALIKVEAVRKQVLSEGLLAERVCYELLHCYRRTELQQAAERIVGEDIAYTPGIGLYSLNWMEHLRRSFVEWIGSVRELPLTEALLESRVRWPILATCEEATLEALIALWPEVNVSRSSIFNAIVKLEDNRDTVAEGLEYAGDTSRASTLKKQVRERRPTQKIRSSNQTTQGDLWDM